MNICKYLASVCAFLLASSLGYATPDRTQLVVWANEAIIATYTYNYKNYIEEQKKIAQYFSAEGWLSYNKALVASKLPEAVQSNQYDVTAVATKPPILTTLDATHWVVTMPVLVQYQNPSYTQQQQLKVVLGFSQAPEGQGVRGFNITSLQSTLIKPPCQCVEQAVTP